MINSSQQEITFDVVNSLVRKLPDDIEITFVGGQAVNFWMAIYGSVYSDEFTERDDIVFGTADIDIVASSEDAIRCAQAWNGKVIEPSQDNHTPNSAIVTVNVDSIGEVNIDFLLDYMKPSKLKSTYFEEIPLSENKPIYILAPLATLLAKIANTLILRRDDEHALGQLRAALIITRCYILDAISDGDQHEASRVVLAILHITRSSAIGWPLLNNYCVDTLEALPSDLSKLDPRFLEHQVQPAIDKITKRRQHVDQNEAICETNSVMEDYLSG